MKVLNVVLSILILLLAAVSAVSSYFLFAKRGQMVKGWEKMATAISQTAGELDKNSGTTVGKDLTAASLAHGNYDTLDSRLGKLKAQAAQLVAERDALAEAVRRAGAIVEMKNLPELAAVRDLATYNASKDSVLGGVTDFKNRRDQLIQQVCTAGGKLGARLNAAEFKGAGADAAFRKFDARVDALRAQFVAYQTNARAIAQITGIATPELGENAYAASLNRVAESVRALKTRLNETLTAMENTKQQLGTTQGTVKQRDNHIGVLKSSLMTKDEEIAQYRKALGLDPKTPFTPWLAGSAESRRAVKGKVIEVNDKFGFIAIDLGKNTTVTQQVGNRTTQVDPKIEKGLTMYVVRQLGSPEVQLVATVKLTNVDGDCSIAETVDAVPDQHIAAGDEVIFQESGKVPAPAAPAAAKK